MRSASTLAVSRRSGGGHRIDRMTSEAPVAWRPAGGAVYLVSTSAWPVGEDQVSLTVEVGEGAELAVRSNAATVVWSSQGSVQSVDVRVGKGSSLVWAPEPVITTSRCRHIQRSTVTMAAGSSLDWRESLILGRGPDEDVGSLCSRLDVIMDGRPLLRHELLVGQGAPGWATPSVGGQLRAISLRLLAGGAAEGIPPSAGKGWMVSPLDGPGLLMMSATAVPVPALLFAESPSGHDPTGLTDHAKASGRNPN